MLPEPQVFVHKKDLAAFRRRVAYQYRKHPKAEYIEGLLIRKDDRSFHILKFQRLWIEKRSKWEVTNNSLQFYEFQNQARQQGLLVGTIHTHTIADSAPSHADITGGVEDEEALLGICEVDELESGRLKMHIDFWVPRLPAKINQVCE